MTAAVSPTPEPYEVPEGGLGSFLTATVGDWSDEALNADNYYDIVKPTAEQLAAFGREEDDRIAHVATGETVIPMAVFEEDPALKEAVFNRMMEMGIDPERYVVGNELNSINPVTGQPEFFLKKIFKGVKKAVKGVVKVFKKVAPIVLSTVGFMVAGPIGASLGSGIGTLIQGGDLKDAFKAAVISGITAGVGQGIGQGIESFGQAGGSFGQKLAAGAQGFGESISSGLSGGYVDQFAQGFSNLTGQAATQTAADQALASSTSGAPITATDAVADAFGPVGPGADGITYAAGPSPYAGDPVAMASTNVTPDLVEKAVEEVVVTAPRISPQTPVLNTAQAAAASGVADRVLKAEPDVDLEAEGVYDPKDPNRSKRIFDQIQERQKLTNALRSGDLKEAFIPRSYTATDILELKGIDPFSATNAQFKAAEALAKQLSPKLLRQYGPAFLGIAGLGAATGAFDVPEMEELDQGIFGLDSDDIRRMNPQKFGQMYYNQRPAFAGQAPTGRAAGGGDISNFPRKTGPIYGPGTETSDDIPAMLSDGEFVMTAKAVRGAGNGSRRAGMNRMYDMMRTFERGV